MGTYRGPLFPARLGLAWARAQAADKACEEGRKLCNALSDCGEDWDLWLQTLAHAGYSEATARRRIELFLFAVTRPGWFEQLRGLGPAKLYRVARMRPEALEPMIPGWVAEIGPAVMWPRNN